MAALEIFLGPDVFLTSIQQCQAAASLEYSLRGTRPYCSLLLNPFSVITMTFLVHALTLLVGIQIGHLTCQKPAPFVSSVVAYPCLSRCRNRRPCICLCNELQCSDDCLLEIILLNVFLVLHAFEICVVLMLHLRPL